MRLQEGHKGSMKRALMVCCVLLAGCSDFPDQDLSCRGKIVEGRNKTGGIENQPLTVVVRDRTVTLSGNKYHGSGVPIPICKIGPRSESVRNSGKDDLRFDTHNCDFPRSNTENRVYGDLNIITKDLMVVATKNMVQGAYRCEPNK